MQQLHHASGLTKKTLHTHTHFFLTYLLTTIVNATTHQGMLPYGSLR